ncbi:MAG: alkaline phosphatase family protein [Candidatus Methanofastidiosia archaeon]
MMTRTLIIGLDGATWDILMPLIEKNKLPTFKKLLENGVHGPLESTIPPVTGPSWLSFATGKNPGKTGIYDFLNRNDIDLRLKPVSSKSYQGQSIWDYLTINDYKVGVVAYPNLYPPYPTNNFMISGIGAPLGGNITYPKKLREEIDDVSKGYELVISYHNVKYNNMELFIRDVNRLIDKQFKIALHLLETKDWYEYPA